MIGVVLKNLICALILFTLIISVFADNAQNFFKNDYCKQDIVKPWIPGNATIDAKVNGQWSSYPLCSFPNQFKEWNAERRLEYIKIFEAMLKGDRSQSPPLSGPHNGIVATYGFKRSDTLFELNNAVKGMGFVPKADKMKEMLKTLNDNKDADMNKKLEILEFFYTHLDSLFESNQMISLELYATSEFQTQSFLNQMTYPVSAVVFLDIPSYKFKAITRILDPKDPQLNDYEKSLIEYCNAIHSFFHGHFEKTFITSVYYAVEVYDNSPRGRNKDEGMGRKINP